MDIPFYLWPSVHPLPQGETDDSCTVSFAHTYMTILAGWFAQ